MEVVEASATFLGPCELCETFTASVEADTTSSGAYCTHLQTVQDTGLLVSLIIDIDREMHVVDFHKLDVYIIGRTLANE